MLPALIAAALSRRSIVLLMLGGFLIAGISAYLHLNIEAYPNPAPVILEITAQAPGLSAEEMERLYTRPMEVGLATTPGIDNIRSTSFYGLSFVRVTFKYGIDYYFAYAQAALSLQQNVNLPNNVQPQIQASSLVGEIFRYQLLGPAGMSLNSLRSLQDWVVTRRLLTVPGVAQVVTWGGTTREYEVQADLKRMQNYGISLGQMINAIGNGNVNVGGRTVRLGQQSVNIRGLGLAHNVEDIAAIVLSQNHGIPIRVSDVAQVRVSHVPRLGQAGRDEQDDVVTGIVVMNRTQQTRDVVARVQQAVDTLNSDGTLPRGVHLQAFYDRASLVHVTTHTVLHNLIFGCILVFFIQWIFLGDLRSAIIVSANIPFALFFSIIILVLLGDSANLLSVGAVDFGIIVDSAVILVENIFRNLQRPGLEQEQLLAHSGAGRNPPGWGLRLRMIFASASQVDRAVFFSTAITVAAFLPLFTMTGVEGQIFGPMARTYAYALSGALLATFTITPVLASYLLPAQIEEEETLFVRALRRVYAPMLEHALRYRRLTVTLGVLILGGALWLLPHIGSEFLPALEEGNLWIRATMPSTLSLEAGMASVHRMREILKKYPEVITVVSQHGRPDDGSDAAGFYNVELFVPLKPLDEWPAGYHKEQLVRDLQKDFARQFVGVEFNFSQYIQDNVEEGLSGVKGANSVKILGPDLQVLEYLAEEVETQMRQVRGITDLGIFHVLGQPNLDIQVDRQRAARYGLNSGDVNAVIQTALAGNQISVIQDGERQYPLVLRAPRAQRDSLQAIAALPVAYTNSNGGNDFVPLRDVAHLQLDTGASYIYHEGNERFIPVKFSVRGRDLGSTIAEARQRLREHVHLPVGYRMIWAGEFDEMQQAKARLEVILPIVLGLILILLYTLLNSMRDSLLTLAAIPFACAGGLFALDLSGLNLSVSAAIGFISLFGVAVMNGILIIGYFRQLLDEGLPVLEAMHTAALQRMRPMLMTALSACIGLLPAALSHGIGSQVQRPLATVVVGGMLLGPLMLLLVTPALQVLIIEATRPARAPAPKGDPS